MVFASPDPAGGRVDEGDVPAFSGYPWRITRKVSNPSAAVIANYVFKRKTKLRITLLLRLFEYTIRFQAS